MSFGRTNVDFGAVTLPVGPGKESKTPVTTSATLESDVCRLQAMLSKAGPGRKASVFERSFTRMDSDGRGEPDEVPNELELGLELERLWVCNGNGGIREVRLRLADAIIPGTWVRIFENFGELHIELSAALEGTRQWLDRSSMKLAEDIGSRLQRQVQVTVQSAYGAETTCAVFHWEGSLPL